MVDRLLSRRGRRQSPNRMNAPLSLVKMAQQHRTKIHRPAAGIDFEQPDILTTECVAHAEPTTVPADRAARSDASHDVRGGVLQRRQALRKRAGRWDVELGGRTLPQRLVRAVL